MTITKVTLVTEDAARDDSGPTYHREYHATYAEGYSAAAFLVNTNASLPKWGDALKNLAGDTNVDTTVYASAIKITPHENDGIADSGICVYAVDYKTKVYNFAVNPLDRPPVINGTGSDLTESRNYDSEDRAITNSADDFFESIPDHPIEGGEFTITRNEADNPATTCVVLSNTVNSVDWYGVAAGKALMGKITYSQKTEIVNGVTVNYWEVNYPIKVRVDTWRLRLLDVGWAYKNDAGDRIKFIDKTGEPPAIPQPLNGSDGGKLVSGDPVLYPDEGDEYKPIDEVDWTDVDLPNPFA